MTHPLQSRGRRDGPKPRPGARPTPRSRSQNSHSDLPAALPGILTGILVATARIAGETAPLLFTAFNNQFWSTNVGQPIASLTVQIFTYAISPYDDWHRQAWAGAFLLVVIILTLSIAARLAVRRLERMNRP